MERLLIRFMFLSYALHMLEVDIDIDQEGLTVEQFERIDEHFAHYLGTWDVYETKKELIKLVKVLSKMEVEGEEGC